MLPIKRVVVRMNVAESKEKDMEASEMEVEAECKEVHHAKDTDIKTEPEKHTLEEEFIKLTNTTYSQFNDDAGSNCDPSEFICTPHSNCPCSVHSKFTNSDTENEPLTDTSLNKRLSEGDQNTVDEIKSIGSQPINDTVTLEPPVKSKKYDKSDEKSDNSYNKLIVDIDVNIEDGSNSLLTIPQVEMDQYHRVTLYAEDKGPMFYKMKEHLVTPPIITRNLTEAFKFLPIFGRPKNTAELHQFQNTKVREYVGCDLSDEEFNNLAKFCSPDNLRTGHELNMMSATPKQDPLPDHIATSLQISERGKSLCLVKKLKMRTERDPKQIYHRRLKYRGMKLLPLPQDSYDTSFTPLEPGKDLVFRVRVYRPFYSNGKERQNSRHSIFSSDIVLLGRQKLTVLRDRLVCTNDVGTRLDMSHNPDEPCLASAKDMFPSGFLFINNAFYVDTRPGCKDHSELIRQWASKRGLGDFPRYDMSQVTLDQLLVRLGHPEVYMHQGDCEHPFTFSEVRLLGAGDALQPALYPHHSALSQHQTVYCTTCSELSAKWLVAGCTLVPFEPGFFCEACFKLYLYKDGQKVEDFRAYNYRGNRMSQLKPLGWW